MRLYNLTPEQMEMMDKLWGMETLAEIKNFKDTLPLFRRQQIDTLLEMTRLQMIDDEIDEYGDLSTGKKILDEILR